MATTKTGAGTANKFLTKGRLPPRAICVTPLASLDWVKVTRIDDLGLQDNLESDIELNPYASDSMHEYRLSYSKFS